MECVSVALVLLLPPSKGMSSAPGDGPDFAHAFPEFARDSAPILKHLRSLPARERRRWYGVTSQEKADAAHEQNLRALAAPGIPAILRYTGVVYKSLDYATLPNPEYAAAHVFIVSGLYGLIPASAPIAEYKLPMNPWLASYWREINTRRLTELADLADLDVEHPILSLLPQSHARAIEPAGLHSIDFKLPGGERSAGHFGKAIKGRFTRYVVKRKLKELKAIARFREQGYRFNGQDFVQTEAPAKGDGEEA